MYRLSFASMILLALALCGCGGESATSMDDFSTRQVTLPDGTQIRAEVMIQQKDMARGMMFRESFPEGRGMLFIHGAEGKYAYWMYQVKVPLDIVWMDKQHRVVEISANTPPCTTKASACPQFGGTKNALVVLELPGGYAARHGVKTGEVIQF